MDRQKQMSESKDQSKEKKDSLPREKKSELFWMNELAGTLHFQQRTGWHRNKRQMRERRDKKKNK